MKSTGGREKKHSFFEIVPPCFSKVFAGLQYTHEIPFVIHQDISYDRVATVEIVCSFFRDPCLRITINILTHFLFGGIHGRGYSEMV